MAIFLKNTVLSNAMGNVSGGQTETEAEPNRLIVEHNQ